MINSTVFVHLITKIDNQLFNCRLSKTYYKKN